MLSSWEDEKNGSVKKGKEITEIIEQIKNDAEKPLNFIFWWL